MTLLPSPIPHPLDFSPWDLPDWAYTALEWVVGFDWPEGDEAVTWDVADLWYRISEQLAQPVDESFAAANEFIAAYGHAGITVDGFKTAWDDLSRGEDAPLLALMIVAHELGKVVEETGCDIEGAKLEAWIELGIFVAELVALGITVVLTLGAASPAAAGLIAATRMAIQMIFKRLIAQLSKKAIKQGMKEAAERAAKQLGTKAGRRALAKGRPQGGPRRGPRGVPHPGGHPGVPDLQRPPGRLRPGGAGAVGVGRVRRRGRVRRGRGRRREGARARRRRGGARGDRREPRRGAVARPGGRGEGGQLGGGQRGRGGCAQRPVGIRRLDEEPELPSDTTRRVRPVRPVAVSGAGRVGGFAVVFFAVVFFAVLLAVFRLVAFTVVAVALFLTIALFLNVAFVFAVAFLFACRRGWGSAAGASRRGLVRRQRTCGAQRRRRRQPVSDGAAG